MSLIKNIKLVLLLLFFLASCTNYSVKMDPQIALPEIPRANYGSIFPLSEDPHLVFIPPFLDLRVLEPLVFYKLKASKPPLYSISPYITNVVSNEFRSMGFFISKKAKYTIRGSVDEWKVDLFDGVPVKAKAYSQISLQVLDERGLIMYEAMYKNNLTAEKMIIEMPDVNKMLGVSMGKVLKKVVMDKELVRVLTGK